MRYSVITLSHNKLECTRRCLSGLIQESRTEHEWELIVVDNGSGDGSYEWCCQELRKLGDSQGVKVTVLRNESNIGCSYARNQGIGVAVGEYLVFVDNDITPRTSGWLDELCLALESTPGVGMVGAKMIYPWEPFDIQCAGVGISKRGGVCFRGRGESRLDPRYNRREQVQCLISACLMVPTALIAEHGGFDEAFHPVQFEDFDLVYRLREAGYAALYVPEVEMYHFESVTTQGTPTVHNAAVVVRNGLLFKRRWRHMFEQEDGPAEEECRWRRVDNRAFESIGELSVV